MNLRNRLLVKGLLALLALWFVVAMVTRWAGSLTPTPAKIEKFVAKNPLSEIEDPDERKRVISRVAEMMNQLDPEDLRDLERRGTRESREAILRSMTPEEQWFFMEKRMGRAFSQMMEVFNEMERSERKATVERALSQLRKNEGGNGPMDEASPEMVEKIASAGMKAYFEDSSAETKMDLAPLMEEIQSIMSNPGRRHRRQGQ